MGGDGSSFFAGKRDSNSRFIVGPLDSWGRAEIRLNRLELLKKSSSSDSVVFGHTCPQVARTIAVIRSHSPKSIATRSNRRQCDLSGKVACTRSWLEIVFKMMGISYFRANSMTWWYSLSSAKDLISPSYRISSVASTTWLCSTNSSVNTSGPLCVPVWAIPHHVLENGPDI